MNQIPLPVFSIECCDLKDEPPLTVQQCLKDVAVKTTFDFMRTGGAPVSDNGLVLVPASADALDASRLPNGALAWSRDLKTCRNGR